MWYSYLHLEIFQTENPIPIISPRKSLLNKCKPRAYLRNFTVVQKSKLFLVKAREVDPTTGGIQGAYAHPLGPFPSLTKCSTHRLKPPPPPLFVQEFVWVGGKLKQSSFPVVAVVVVVVVYYMLIFKIYFYF